METKQCSYTKEDGQQCSAWALKGEDYCFRHSPGTRALSLEASRKGGLVKKTEIPLEAIPISTPRDAVVLLTKTINEVRAGKIDTRVANTIGYLAGVLVRALEVTEVARKVDEIRAVLLVRANPEKD